MKTTNMTVIYDKEVLGRGFKIYGTEENPLFLAKDVAEWIDYSKDSKGNYRLYKMVETVDEAEKQKIIHPTINGVYVAQWFLTEDGLYEVLMQSRKPIAKAFKKEVKTILKQIRQTGGYIPLTEQDDELTIMSKALMIAQNTLVRKDKLIKQKEQRIIELEPKANYYDSVLQPKNLITVTQIAKDLGMSAIQLNNLLNSKGIIYKKGSTWYPYSNYNWLIEDGYADYAMGVTGVGMSHQLLKWTERGRKWIIETVLTSM